MAHLKKFLDPQPVVVKDLGVLVVSAVHLPVDLELKLIKAVVAVSVDLEVLLVVNHRAIQVLRDQPFLDLEVDHVHQSSI